MNCNGNMLGTVGEDFDFSYYKEAERLKDYILEDEGP